MSPGTSQETDFHVTPHFGSPRHTTSSFTPSGTETRSSIQPTPPNPQNLGGGAQESNLPETTFAASHRF